MFNVGHFVFDKSFFPQFKTKYHNIIKTTNFSSEATSQVKQIFIVIVTVIVIVIILNVTSSITETRVSNESKNETGSKSEAPFEIRISVKNTENHNESC